MAEKDEQVQEVVAEQAGTPTALEIQLDTKKAIARIQDLTQIIDGCTKVSIQRTNAKDWVKMGGAYYLQATGAQKIRPIWGIYYRDRHVTKETNPDGSYTFIVTGTVGSKLLDQLYGETIIDIEGGRSSNDPFFVKGEREPDPMDVRKASIANWEARAVTALLGLKNFTVEDLKRNGIDVTQVGVVDYQKGAEGGGKTELISQPQQKRLFALCKESNITDPMLKTFLSATYNITSSSQIKRTDYEAICTWVQTGGNVAPKRDAGEGQ
ncbi:MAG: hypothetical protein MUP81_03290 [Dehalococcoidia bacterium]|nr:hypothetical protein [Dehalococcoidia bacterium]